MPLGNPGIHMDTIGGRFPPQTWLIGILRPVSVVNVWEISGAGISLTLCPDWAVRAWALEIETLLEARMVSPTTPVAFSADGSASMQARP